MNKFLIFFMSTLVCVITLALERIAGIDWDYHPDVVTYTTTYMTVVDQGLEALPNQMYYFVAALAGGNVSALILLNILAYCMTNVILASVYADFCYEKTIKKNKPIILLFLLLFAPYRLHLAIHALKDTFIILTLCLFTAYQGRKIYSWLALIPLFLLRIYAAFYMLLLIRGRLLWPLIIALGVAIISSTDLLTLDLLYERNETSMRSREFDIIPDFYEWGIIGTFIRMIVWPFLMVTGAFVILSPALPFIPVAFDVLLARTWSRYIFGHFGLRLGLILCLSVIAAFVNSFTSYVRYCYPALVVMPIIIMRNTVINGKATKPSKAL